MASNIIKFIVVIILAFCGYIFSQEDVRYLQKGNKKLEKGNYENDILYYSSAIKVNPLSEYAYFNCGATFKIRGLKLVCMQKYYEALWDLEKANRLDYNLYRELKKKINEVNLALKQITVA